MKIRKKYNFSSIYLSFTHSSGWIVGTLGSKIDILTTVVYWWAVVKRQRFFLLVIRSAALACRALVLPFTSYSIAIWKRGRGDQNKLIGQNLSQTAVIYLLLISFIQYIQIKLHKFFIHDCCRNNIYRKITR